MKTHKLLPHQTLQQLSKLYGIPVCMLLRANGGRLAVEMRIPPTDFCMQLGDCETATHLHLVMKGETLHAIAQTYQVTAVALMQENGILSASVLRPDMMLKIPVPPPGTYVYACNGADTFADIAARHGISQTALLELNGLPAAAAVYPGLELYLPKVK